MFSVYVRQSLIQLYTPDAMRGRVGAVSSLFISASNELGEAESGFLGALIGPVPAVIAGGVGAIAWSCCGRGGSPSCALQKASTHPICALHQQRSSQGMKAANILETIGNTPHVRINRLFGDRAEVWIKQERANPGGSIKDRIALAMVEDAERSGKLKPGGTIVEPTSGNTGIGLAMVAAVKGYKLILVMPDSMSVERRRLMLAYGATFDLTPREKGMKGSIARAQEIVAADRRRVDAAAVREPGQPRSPPPHDRAGNPARFRRQSARRDHHRRRHRRPHHRLRRGAEAGMAEPQGVRGRADAVAGAFRRPARARTRSRASAPASSRRSWTPSVLDGVIQVDPNDAKEMARRAAREEGMLVGISSGATLAAIAQKLPELGEKAARPRLQLRHRRALSLGSGLPSRKV